MSDIRQILAQVTLYSDEQLYHIIHLPAGAITAAASVLAEVGEPFSAAIVDKDEVTLIVGQEIWENFKTERLPDHKVAPEVFRLLTFDLPIDMTLVGFMSLVSRVLADAGVPLMAFSAYMRDHLLIQETYFDTAWIALEALTQ